MSRKETLNLRARPPIVVVMGHVDHGKTTLLDYIRKTTVAARAVSPKADEPRPVAGREAGGITQSIGAYEIEHKNRKITFIDTPGHEAFTKMRSAGASVADLAILVVAAEEGLKPQTHEAIKILKDTNTAFIVAINKIDKSSADIEKVKNELTAAGVLLEGYGGQISYHGISAKTGEGVDDLLDLIALTADIENLTWNPENPPSGFVLEARLDRRRGLETIAILKDGILKTGYFVKTPSTHGRIKILENFMEKSVKELEPSAPALIMGFEKLPQIGETFLAASSEEALKAIAQPETQPSPERGAAPRAQGEAKTKLILKAEDSGSLEALSLVMKNLNLKNQPAILGESIGDVGDGDIKMAIATGAMIIGFKVKISPAAKNLAEAQRVNIITSEIIYDLTKAVEEFFGEPQGAEAVGELEILAVFSQEKATRQVVGGKVMKGTFKNKAAFEIQRGEEIAGRGRVTNLQEQKKDAAEVPEGKECGLLVSADTLIAVGDRLRIK